MLQGRRIPETVLMMTSTATCSLLKLPSSASTHYRMKFAARASLFNQGHMHNACNVQSLHSSAIWPMHSKQHTVTWWRSSPSAASTGVAFYVKNVLMLQFETTGDIST